jgi:hypothetical protein
LLAGLTLLAAACGPVAARPKLVTSNTQLLLDGTVSTRTGEGVTLLALVHLQTQVDVSTGTVEVQANLRDESLAYITTNATPGDPNLTALQALEEAAQDLQRRINDLRAAVVGAQQELAGVLSHDVNPLLPGLQIDQQRASELQRRLEQLTAELARLQKELAGVYSQIKSLIDKIQEQQPEVFSLYSAAGAYRAAPSPAGPDGFYEKTVHFALLQPDGRSIPFAVRLRLQFSLTGDVVSDDAAVTYEPPPGGGDTPLPCP